MKLSLSVLLLSVAIAGCRNSLESDAPFIRGTITVRDVGGYGGQRADGTIGLVEYPRILVEADPSDPIYGGKGSQKSRVAWGDDTEILSASGHPTTADDLQVGKKVSVWITGTVLDSYPDQVGATLIVIEKD